jgi:hypothetical protein
MSTHTSESLVDGHPLAAASTSQVVHPLEKPLARSPDLLQQTDGISEEVVDIL